MPFPDPVTIRSADICRDGGTLVLEYNGCDGMLHEVTLPVRLDEEGVVIGYRTPLLRSYPAPTNSSVFGESLEAYQTAPVSSLNWDEAALLGECLVPLIYESMEREGCSDRANQAVKALLRGGRPL